MTALTLSVIMLSVKEVIDNQVAFSSIGMYLINKAINIAVAPQCYVQEVTRKQLVNQIIIARKVSNKHFQFIEKVQNYQLQETMENMYNQRESNLQYLNFKSKLSLRFNTHKSFNSF